MPQLDISFYIPQLFWLLVIFGGLYLCMAYGILPRLERSLKTRENALNQLRHRAQELEMEVETLRRSNESKLRTEHDTALEQISDYTQKWKKEATQKEFELQPLMHQRLDALYQDLQGQQREILRSMKDKEKELVALVVEHLTGVEAPKQSVAKAIRKTRNHETIH
jgi:F-type H+-transporting ATPase subunit b